MKPILNRVFLGLLLFAQCNTLYAADLTVFDGTDTVTINTDNIVMSGNSDNVIEIVPNDGDAQTNNTRSEGIFLFSNGDPSNTSIGTAESGAYASIKITTSTNEFGNVTGSVTSRSQEAITMELDTDGDGGGIFTITDAGSTTLSSSSSGTTITSSGSALSATSTGASISSSGGGVSITSSGGDVATQSNENVTIVVDSDDNSSGSFTVTDSSMNTLSSSSTGTTITSTGSTLSAASTGVTITSSGGDVATQSDDDVTIVVDNDNDDSGSFTVTDSSMETLSSSADNTTITSTGSTLSATATGVTITSSGGDVTTQSNENVAIVVDSDSNGSGAFTVTDSSMNTLTSSADSTTITSTGSSLSATSTGVTIASSGGNITTRSDDDVTIEIGADDIGSGTFSITDFNDANDSVTTLTSSADNTTITSTGGTISNSSTGITLSATNAVDASSAVTISGATAPGSSSLVGVTITGNGNGSGEGTYTQETGTADWYDVVLLSNNGDAGIRINDYGVEIITPQLVSGGEDYNNDIGSGINNATSTTLNNAFGLGGSGIVNNTIGTGGNSATSEVYNTIGLAGAVGSTVINNIGTTGGGGATATNIGNSVTTSTFTMTAGAASTTANSNTLRDELGSGVSALSGTTQATSALSGISHAGESSAVFDSSGALSIGTTQQTTASLVVTNGLGNTHGLVVNEEATVLSGGTHSSSFIIDNNGVRFSNSADGGAITVTGVADGHHRYDAVNRGQLNVAYSGIASIAAMSQIPSQTNGGRHTFGIGVGYFEDEGALAMGFKSALNHSTNLSISLGHDTQRRTSMAAGIGWNWW